MTTEKDNKYIWIENLRIAIQPMPNGKLEGVIQNKQADELFSGEFDSEDEAVMFCKLWISSTNKNRVNPEIKENTEPKKVNIKFLKQGLVKAEVPADLKGDFLADYCKEILDNTSDQDLINAMIDINPISLAEYGMFDADQFQVEIVEDAETFDKLFQTKRWEYFGDEDAILDLEAENKSMGCFLEEQLGFSRDDVCDIAHDSTKLYCVHVVCDNELKSYKHYTKIEDAHAAYIKLCEEWYNQDALSSFCEAGKTGTTVECYDSYYGSPEYHNVRDNVHVSLEVLNAWVQNKCEHIYEYKAISKKISKAYLKKNKECEITKIVEVTR